MIKLVYIFMLIFFSLNLEAQIKPSKHEPAYIGRDTITIYKNPEVMPQFPGGEIEMMKYISQYLRYPILDQSELIDNGRFVVRFVVRETGEIDNIRLIRPLTKSFEKEVIRFVESMPKWIPGKVNGKNVACYFTIPIQICFRTK
ncbi:TonB-like protein [Dysgonomonas alginatilytica]|uniref:TonB-like protein n=1 Tax=Dysgonomonas alginatilytica TaxID=1605892 RepID=A0A2V3PNJ2_9BACT|nr:energy transducer TonB [Dysgonomonas alginatilytica]PXV64078.1 TonB-like protein [Dysgonomonas alginatilytica]